MSFNAKKNQAKMQNYNHKPAILICNEPLTREDLLKNKISHNEEFQKHKGPQHLQLDINPIIVTRRNISTVQTKRANYLQDEDDLMLTTSFMRKKEPAIHTFNNNQIVKESFNKVGDRPRSKQQPRSKGWNNNELLLKSTVKETDRPQTSKGARPKQMDKSKVQQTFHDKNEYSNQLSKVQNDDRKSTQTSRVIFKTSIDSEFLSLFAS